MKHLPQLLTLTLTATLGLQALAFTKGQAVYTRIENKKPPYTSTLDFSKPFEVIDIDGDSLTIFRRDLGALQVDENRVFEEKKVVSDWYDGNLSWDEKTHVKMPSITKGSTVVTNEYQTNGYRRIERQVKRVFQTPAKEIAFVFEDGTSGNDFHDFWVMDDPKKGTQSITGNGGTVRIGDAAASYEDYRNWNEGRYDLNTIVNERVPVAKVAAIAFQSDYGYASPLFRVGKQWLKYDEIYVQVAAAYGVKTGDTVSSNYRFDLRVEQLLRDPSPSYEGSPYTAVLSAGGVAYLNQSSAAELLAHRACKGTGQSSDQICENYRSSLESSKERDLYECSIENKTIKISMKKKTLQFPGGKVSAGTSITADIVDWNAVIPASDLGRKGQTVNVRLRYDAGIYGSLFVSVNGERGERLGNCEGL